MDPDLRIETPAAAPARASRSAGKAWVSEMNATESRSPWPLRGISEWRMAVLIGCGCCLMLIAIGWLSSVASSAVHDPDLLAVNATDKGPRIVPRSGIDFACKGQNWGHESSECLAAIRIQTGQRRSIRIIADGGNDSQAQ